MTQSLAYTLSERSIGEDFCCCQRSEARGREHRKGTDRPFAREDGSRLYLGGPSILGGAQLGWEGGGKGERDVNEERMNRNGLGRMRERGRMTGRKGER